jgi:predicted regulator of Ras-like GTPase activity (Roadblock/LC7/MglB family)
MAVLPEGETPSRDLAWLLDDLADRLPDFRRAVIAASGDLTREDAEHLSAVAAAVQSLAAGTGDRFSAGGVRQTIIELEHGIFFLIAAGQGSCLAALCPSEADAGTVAYEMAMLAKRARPHLAALPRMRSTDFPAG